MPAGDEHLIIGATSWRPEIVVLVEHHRGFPVCSIPVPAANFIRVVDDGVSGDTVA
jgi:hypothetical protein